MGTQWIVNGQVVAEAPSIFGNDDLAKEVENGIKGKDRRALSLSPRDRRKKKS